METPEDAEPCDCKKTPIAEVIAGEIMDCNSPQQEDEDDDKPDLLNLPQEVLFHIFSFIDADYLLNNVSCVCQYLKNLLSNEKYWRSRLFQRFPKPFPIIQDDDLSWKEACKEREMCKRIYKNSKMPESMITLNKASGFAMDAVHLMENKSLCLAGSRDRSITVWKLNPESGSNNEVDTKDLLYKNLLQHNGWVWSITSRGNQFCSTSFDSTIKFWDVNTLNMLQSLNVKTAVLCSSYLDDNTLVAGCYNKKTIIIDSRSSSVSNVMIHHRRAVLKVATNDYYIVSAGEDGRLVIIDRRNYEVLQEVRISSFVMSLDVHSNQIWTGLRSGDVQVYDACDFGNIIMARKLHFGYRWKVTGLIYRPGAVYSGSADGWVKVHEPTFDPDYIARVHLKRSGGVADMSLVDKRLAVATGEGLVALWDP